jgi:hypothetical protein
MLRPDHDYVDLHEFAPGKFACEDDKQVQATRVAALPVPYVWYRIPTEPQT